MSLFKTLLLKYYLLCQLHKYMSIHLPPLSVEGNFQLNYPPFDLGMMKCRFIIKTNDSNVVPL